MADNDRCISITDPIIGTSLQYTAYTYSNASEITSHYIA